MIAVDTNILVYAHRRDAEWHEVASGVLRGLAEGRHAWALPWSCVHEFLAIVTHPKIFNPPSSTDQACDQVEAWLESPSVTLIGEDSGHWRQLRGLVTTARITGAKVHDARVAAVCMRHGVKELWSADRDFSRFRDLRVRNPLAARAP